MRLLLISLVLLSLFFGCTQSQPASPPASDGAENSAPYAEDYADTGDYAPAPEIYFWPYEILPDATIGVPYRYSFCNPEPVSAWSFPLKIRCG